MSSFDFSLAGLNLPDKVILAIDGERGVTKGELFASIAAQRRECTGLPRRRVLMRNAAPIDFAIDLLALLADDHVAVIPPNFQPQTLKTFAELAPPVDIPSQTIEIYTSGSSGKPKCVSKTLRQIKAESSVLERCWGERAAEATVIATTPHHHIYGLLFRLLWPLLAGRTFDNATVSEPTTLFARLRATKKSVLVSSPAQLSRLHQLVDLATLPHRPVLIFSSGGPLDAETATLYRENFGEAPIEVFGSTESGGIAWRRQDLGPYWTPLPEVRLSSANDNALLVQSPFLPDEEPLRMEDAVKFNADGTFQLHGRLDRIIKIEEKRLSLPEMENWLAQHPLINGAAVAPIRRSGRTFVGAVVALQTATNRRAIIDVLRQHLRQRFDNVLLPRRWRFVETLPFNERGKLEQAEISRLLETLL